jgi:hypothetical protein
MTSLGIDISKPLEGLNAVFTSKVTLKDLTAGTSIGGVDLQVNMTDRGEPGSSDAIGISVYNGSILLYSSYWKVNLTAQMMLGGGNLLVHSSASTSVSGTVSKSIETQSQAIDGEPALKVFPNPFTDHLYFELQWPSNAKARIELYNLGGNKIATVYSGDIEAGMAYRFDYTPENIISGMLIYHLIIGDKVIFVGKVIHQ